MRDVFGRGQSRPENGQARGEQTEGAVRTDAGDLRVRHQHDRGQGSETVRVSDLQETAEDGSEIRGLDRFRDGQQSETLDAERRCTVVRYKIISLGDIIPLRCMRIIFEYVHGRKKKKIINHTLKTRRTRMRSYTKVYLRMRYENESQPNMAFSLGLGFMCALHNQNIKYKNILTDMIE